MKMKKRLAILLALLVSLNCLCATAGAVSGGESKAEPYTARATGEFDMNIPGKTIVAANSSFPLLAGEMVTIKATYSPFSASVDFGLIAPDGNFYFINVDNGSIDKTIKVEERGNYIFAVRNNSTGTISVSGYINY